MRIAFDLQADDYLLVPRIQWNHAAIAGRRRTQHAIEDGGRRQPRLLVFEGARLWLFLGTEGRRLGFTYWRHSEGGQSDLLQGAKKVRLTGCPTCLIRGVDASYIRRGYCLLGHGRVVDETVHIVARRLEVFLAAVEKLRLH